MKPTLIATAITTSILTVLGVGPANALTNVETCTSPVYDSYFCVQDTGYVGEDPYDVDRFSSTDSPDHTKHGCTSFAAYMLALFNPWMQAISFFNAARSWDTDATTKVGATLVSDPNVGDIAQWDQDSKMEFGHVAYVYNVARLHNTGTILYIQVEDDNGGRNITTRRTLYPGATSGTISWPDHFIRFPKSNGSGGGCTFACPMPLSTINISDQ